jgi:hypothetical protein
LKTASYFFNPVFPFRYSPTPKSQQLIAFSDNITPRRNQPMRLLQLLSALLVVTTAHASLTYTFTYTPNSGPIQGFSFTFSTPTFITEKGPFAFEPFSYTDGTSTWTMAESLAGIAEVGMPAVGCLYFVTAENADIGNCTSTIFPPNSGNLAIALLRGFPTEVGTYSSPMDINFGSAVYKGFDPISFILSRDTGTGILVISGDAVPEPGTTTLILLGMAGIQFLSRYRACARIHRGQH